MAELSSIRKLMIRLFISVVFLLIWGMGGYAQTIDSISFTYTNNLCGSAVVKFKAIIYGSNINTTDYDFAWNFGDGKTDVGQELSHGFPVEPGAPHLVSNVETPFNVILTITNKTSGSTNTITKQVIVRPSPIPILAGVNNNPDPFNNCANNPTPLKPNFIVSVLNKSINASLISNYNIDWGDGKNDQFTKSNFPSILIHTYTQLGLFKLKFTTTGDNGCDSTIEYRVKNLSNPGIGISTTGNTEGCAPIPFSFKLNGIKNNDAETSYLFDFGDGKTQTWTQADAIANDSIITHIYTRSSCDQPGRAYTVKVIASNDCKSTLATIGGVKVSSMPIPIFSATNLCEDEPVQFTNSSFIDCSNKVSYIWNFGDGSPVVTTTSNTTVTHKFPLDNTIYIVSLKILSSCQDTTISKAITLIKSPVADFELSSVQDCLNVTSPFVVNATNKSTGVYKSLLWSVTPTTGWKFSQGGPTSNDPQFSFNKKGIYTVSLRITNSCKSVYKYVTVMVNGLPNATFPQIKPQCDNYIFDASQTNIFKIDSIAKENISAKWTITPETGWSFIAPTTATSIAPKISFTSNGDFTISVNLKNDCGDTTLSRILTIGKFTQVTVGQDSTFCTNTDLIKLVGNPTGGDWSIQPDAPSSLIKIVGDTSYFDPSVPGIYTLTYKRGVSYCYSEASKKYTVIALPVVSAGPDFNICKNQTTPYSLNGTPVGGTWSGPGITGNTFSPGGMDIGSYILKYSYTDPNTLCTNTDQVVVRILDVPATGFNIPVQGCKDQPITFIPFGPANTIYNWNFGDGHTVTTTGSASHTYRTSGIYTINLNSADSNYCENNTSKSIWIQDTISIPVITYAPKNGCGPLTVNFAIDTTGATKNGQTYHWDFGNGDVKDGIILEKQITYNPGLADTSYTVRLTASNNCFTKIVYYPIVVKSEPHADFNFPHPYECSPATVKFRNTAADRKASFLWDFGDGTTSTDFEPSHLFTTGKTATTFKIKLLANNGCGKDSVTKTLLVKPNSIEAFIEMNVRQACPGDIIMLRNLSTDTVTKISNYYWDFGDGTISNTWDATHAYTTAGKYTIKLYVDNGCSQAEKTEQIEILPVPDLQIICLDSICKGDTLKLEGNYNNVDLMNTKWDFGDGSFGTGSSTSHVYNTVGWHTITYHAAYTSSILQCAATKTKRVYVKDSPSQLSLPDMAGCSPFSISISPPGSDAYLWNFGDDNLWIASGKHTFINNGAQPVRKKVSIMAENNFLCRTASYFWVTIYPNPVAKIGVRSEGGYPESVYFKNLSMNSTLCEWLFPDGNTAISCDSILYRFYNTGFSRIYLKTSNQYGCTDTTSIIHQTLLKGLFVPNALQPSNADPLVKVFKPIGIGLKTYHLGIYDIWGNLIWETEKLKDTQTDEGWNGQTKSGKDLPQGVYIWRISATFVDGTAWKGMKQKDDKTRTEGTITLIR